MKKLFNTIGIATTMVYCNVVYAAKPNITLGTSGSAEFADSETWLQDLLDTIIGSWMVFALVIALIIGICAWVFDAKGQTMNMAVKAVVGVLFIGGFLEVFVTNNLV